VTSVNTAAPVVNIGRVINKGVAMAEKKVKSEMKCPKCGYTCFNMSGGDVECARCGHFGKIR
jgi:ribosomal protein L37AE/L43A